LTLLLAADEGCAKAIFKTIARIAIKIFD